MPEPIILSTWRFGQQANAAGWPLLIGQRPSALDAVEQACRAIEADPQVTSVGLGGYPDQSGEVTLDASIMLSPARCGSVCCVRRFLHPVSIARLVMEHSPHTMLAGDGAERFAAAHGEEPADLLTGPAREAWEKWLAGHARGPTGPRASSRQSTPRYRGRVGPGRLRPVGRGLLDQRHAHETARPRGRFADHRPRPVRRSALRSSGGDRTGRMDHGRLRQFPGGGVDAPRGLAAGGRRGNAPADHRQLFAPRRAPGRYHHAQPGRTLGAAALHPATLPRRVPPRGTR